MEADFRTRKITITGGGYRMRRGLFWTEPVEAVFSTITFPLAHPPAVLAEGQIEEIKAQLFSMPLSPRPFLADSADLREASVAHYVQKGLHSDSFIPGKAPEQLRKICQVIGIEVIFDYWNTKL